MRIGEVVSAPARLTPSRLGLLASVGRVSVRVRPAAPRVAIVATGDELVEPGQPLGPGQIRNSNAPMLRALAMAAGAEAHVLPIAADEPSALSTILRRGLDADVLLISGGVSAGTCDLVPSALEALGVENVFHKVNIKPGKPLWFGVGPSRDSERGPLVFGLPGNPVSGLVGFLVFAAPGLALLAGRRETNPMHRDASRTPVRGTVLDRVTCSPAGPKFREVGGLRRWRRRVRAICAPSRKRTGSRFLERATGRTRQVKLCRFSRWAKIRFRT